MTAFVPTDDPARADQVPVRAVASATLAVLSGATPMIFAGALVVQISDDLEMSSTVFGWTFSAYFITSGLVSRWAGVLVDAVGWPRSTRMAAALSATSLVGIATVARSPATFAAFMVVGGLAQSLGMPSSNLTLSRTVPVRQQAFAFGVKQTANPLAGLLAGLSIPVIALTVGWRWAFAVAVVLPVITGVVTPHRRRPRPTGPRERRARWRPDAHRRWALVLLALSGGLAALCATALSAFVVASAVEAGIDASRAGVFVAVANVVGLCVRLGAGWLTGRRSSTGIRPAAGLLITGSIGYLLLATQRESLVLVGMAFAFGAGSGWPGLYQFGVSAYNRAAPASATGFVQIGVLLGAAFGPIVAGTLLSVTGYRSVWLVVGCVGLTAAAGLLFAAVLLERSPESDLEVAGSIDGHQPAPDPAPGRAATVSDRHRGSIGG